MTSIDRFLHHLSSACAHWPLATPRQEPQPFVFGAVVEKNHAFACRRVMKRAARVLSDQPEERMPPGLIGVMKDLLGKLLELVDADCSDGLGNGFTPLLVESFGVDEFIEWHRTAWLAFRRCDATQEFITNSTCERK
jgi:hypothetical protein